LADENFSRILAISPDDVYIAYGVRESVGAEDAIFITKTNCGHLVMHPDADTDESIEEIATFTKLNINSFDWNPITCCDNYYFAIGGSVEEINGETKNIELFEFNGTNVQSLGSALLPEQTVTDIKWSSRGKDLVATGTNHAVSIFTLDFSNTDTLIGMLTEYKTINTVLGSGDKYADWTSDGRYFVLAGPSATDQEVPNNIEIFYAGDSVSKCVVQGNNVANICGGLCGIGISGAGRLNLIDKNIVCCSGVKYSQGVFAKYLGGLLGTPGLLDNLPGNDCCACCPCVCREPECVCSCEELKSSWYTVKPISRPISRTATSTKGMSDMRDNKAVIDEIEELRDLLFKDFEFRRFLSR